MRASLILLAVPARRQWLIPAELAPGQPLSLTLQHTQRWSRTDVTRVIVGSDPALADVLLVDEPLTFRPEHARFYLNHAQPDQSDLRMMKDCPVLVNNQPHPPLQWIRLRNGDTLGFGDWPFQYVWQD